MRSNASSPIERHIQIGSFSARAFFQERADAVVLNEMFKDTVRELSGADAEPEAELYWSHAPRRETPLVVAPDGLSVRRSGEETWRVESEVLAAQLELGTPRTRMRARVLLTSYPHTLEPLAWRVHVSIVFHKLLMLMGRVYVHAGAAQTGDGASAFVGEKGSGKSTICLWLGRAGATILSDDHILIRRNGGGFYASGCEQVARVTAQTEGALMPDALTMEARDFGGTLKKEFPVGDWFAAMPFRDVRLERIFFPRVGSRWQMEELSARALTGRLVEATRSSHRFANKEDYARHLEYLSALAKAVQGFEVELSTDLNELRHLTEFLGA